MAVYYHKNETNKIKHLKQPAHDQICRIHLTGTKSIDVHIQMLNREAYTSESTRLTTSLQFVLLLVLRQVQ